MKKSDFINLLSDSLNEYSEIDVSLSADLIQKTISESLKSKVENLSESLNIKIELIIGNHDIGCKVKNISFLEYKRSSNFIFSHEPIGKSENNILNICGHYHPKTFLKNSKDKLSFKCFAMDEKSNILYLPAFGELTGGYPCKNSFRKWAIISEKEIIAV